MAPSTVREEYHKNCRGADSWSRLHSDPRLQRLAVQQQQQAQRQHEPDPHQICPRYARKGKITIENSGESEKREIRVKRQGAGKLPLVVHNPGRHKAAVAFHLVPAKLSGKQEDQESLAVRLFLSLT